MSSKLIIGTWEVVGCELDAHFGDARKEKTGIEGTLIKLDECGDVTWTPSPEAEGIPLFNFDTYDVLSTSCSGLAIRFGAYMGHVLTFEVSHLHTIGIDESMALNCEGWIMLHLERTDAPSTLPLDTPFSLLPALEDGYFSDLTIMASNNKKFAVHSCILEVSAPQLDWTAEPPPLSQLREDVLTTVLHYLYAECLPAQLSEATARHVVATACAQLPCLEDSLAPLCHRYLRNTALKQQIISLVTDMHACVTHIIHYFLGKTRHTSTSASPANNPTATPSESLSANPTKLCHAIRQALREAAVAVMKLVTLCDVYVKRKEELSTEQCHEIIRYAKSRLPVFMNQLHRFLIALKSTFTGMSPSQRQEFATYLVPEIEKFLETVASLGGEIKTALERLSAKYAGCSVSVPKNGTQYLDRDVFQLCWALAEELKKKEVKKLRSLVTRYTHILHLLLQRRTSFGEMTIGNKVRSVSRSLEQLTEELPVFLLRLEEVTSALDDKLDWREFKFCFNVGTSRVSGAVQRLLLYRCLLQPVLFDLCQLVARDAFTQSLISLGLLDAAVKQQMQPCPATNTSQPTTPKHHGFKLNLVESLCVPPMSRDSKLSKAATQLLKSGKKTDMLFEIIPSQESGDGEEVVSVRAHRVVVAARCDWFRRALLSGMREAIDRKIVVFDTSPSLFSLLLEYLYSGQVETSRLGVDQLADLMLLGDRYQVDCLKAACERGLSAHCDTETVLYLLTMADQFNAKMLRSWCLNFISLNPEIMDTDLFEELPQNLQAEIYDLVIWVNPRKAKCSGELTPGLAEELAAGLRVDDSLGHDSARLEHCLAQLRDVIGDLGASREQLVQVALAADYDLNRALNFYYTS